MVEVGGVEPPCRHIHPEATTCVSVHLILPREAANGSIYPKASLIDLAQSPLRRSRYGPAYCIDALDPPRRLGGQNEKRVLGRFQLHTFVSN